jgi:hypothetical protein
MIVALDFLIPGERGTGEIRRSKAVNRDEGQRKGLN